MSLDARTELQIRRMIREIVHDEMIKLSNHMSAQVDTILQVFELIATGIDENHKYEKGILLSRVLGKRDDPIEVRGFGANAKERKP